MFLKIQFISLGDFIDNLVSLEISTRIILYFIAFAVGVGVMAGFLPALFYSKIKASQVLKDASTLRIFRRLTLRKALIVLQYTFSLIFITSTLIGYSQYKSFLTFDLGFQTSNIVNISLQGNKDDVLIQELSQLPEVTAISRSRIITSVGNMYGTQAKYHATNDSAVVWLNFIDENYLPLHQHKLLSGANFHAKAPGAEESEVIVNEELLKRFDISKRDPQKALGEILEIDGKNLKIVGVMKDFHYGTVESKIEPVALRYSNHEPSGFLNLKVASTDWPSTFSSIESAWKKVDNVHPVNAQFYDDRIQENYSQFSVMLKVIGFLGFLAICIASMGLFGMVVFNTDRRLKEISIRKVLGATEGALVYLLSKGFLVLLFISAGMALPLTYIFFDKVVLTNFAYHQPIGMVELFAGAVGVVTLAFVMIGMQTLKVARTNPADVLKTD
jgi:ABC-type antimicrobial peptide transport system permease subunit